MYKEDKKYKLIGYQPVSLTYTVPREEIATFKNGHWYPLGSRKRIVNFVIETVIEL
jgi:hypothetical protein